eukprot:9426419-Heterocapsa_arctica.AAC.1
MTCVPVVAVFVVVSLSVESTVVGEAVRPFCSADAGGAGDKSRPSGGQTEDATVVVLTQP